MLVLKQSTASQNVLIGPFVDDTDGATAETGLTIANTDIRLSKNGGNLAAKTSGGGTHDEAGWYQITLDATDTNTVGTLQLHVKVAGALMVHAEFHVLEEEVYDDLFAASAVGYLKPVTGGNDLDVTATGAAGIDWGNVENPTTALDLSGTDIQLVDTCTTNTDMRGTDNAALASVLGALNDAAAAGDPTTADTAMQYVKQLINVLVGSAGVGTFPAAAAPANAVSLAEVIRAIYDDSNSLDGTKIPDTLSLVNINAEVDTALDTAIPGVPTADSINERIAAIDDLSQSGGGGDLAAILTDTAEIGAAGAGLTAIDLPDQTMNITGDITGNLSGSVGSVTARVTANTDQINGDATAAANLEASAETIVTATAQTGSTTTVIETDLTEATDDHYKGRIVVFRTGAAADQATDITAYNGTSKALTVTALTDAPANGDTFVIV